MAQRGTRFYVHDVDDCSKLCSMITSGNSIGKLKVSTLSVAFRHQKIVTGKVE